MKLFRKLCNHYIRHFERTCCLIGKCVQQQPASSDVKGVEDFVGAWLGEPCTLHIVPGAVLIDVSACLS